MVDVFKQDLAVQVSDELFIARLIVPGALHRPKGILVCFMFTQFASPSPKSRLLEIRSEIKSRSVQLGIRVEAETFIQSKVS